MVQNIKSDIKLISLVFPVYNEQDSLLVIEKEIKLLKSQCEKYQFECIFVNDGSRDNSWQVMNQISDRNENFKLVNLSRNFGHQEALSAGLSNAQGAAIVCLDSDLQHPIDFIPNLLAKWEEGYHIVNTQRRSDEKLGFLKRLTSRLFYKIFNLISDIQLLEGGADFRLIDASVLKILIELKETDRFYRGLVSWVGFRSTYLPFQVRERKYGKSNYSIGKMLSLALSGLSTFSTKPLKLIFVFGFALFFVSIFGFVSVATVKYILGKEIFTGTAVLIFLILIVNAIQLIAMGIMSYFIYSINKEVKSRPPYLIQEIVESKSWNINRRGSEFLEMKKVE